MAFVSPVCYGPINIRYHELNSFVTVGEYLGEFCGTPRVTIPFQMHITGDVIAALNIFLLPTVVLYPPLLLLLQPRDMDGQTRRDSGQGRRHL